MRERMERFALIPFSISCVSHSSVAVSESQQIRRPQPEPTTPTTKGGGGGGGGGGEYEYSAKVKSPSGLQKLVKSFKSLPQMLSLYEEEEEEIEMEIGLPTDVQHLAHIGLDGFSNVGSMKSRDKAKECFSMPSLSLRQFELAISAQADA